MAVLFLPASLLVAWILAIAGVTPLGAEPDDDFALTAMRWMLTIPVGPMFLVSGFMHTVLAKSTAQSIGWQTSGFQYELGFVSFGIGAAGFWAATLATDSWLVLSLVVAVFLLGAAANHIIEIVRDKNYEPGNSLVLLYDLGLPISLWALLFAADLV